MPHNKNFLAQIGVAFARAKKLRGGFKLAYTILSWLMVLTGCVLSVLFMYWSRRALGIPMTSGSLEGIRLQFLGWILGTAVSIPVAFFAGMFVVGGIAGLCMALLGQITFADARGLALYGQPPERWIQDPD